MMIIKPEKKKVEIQNTKIHNKHNKFNMFTEIDYKSGSNRLYLFTYAFVIKYMNLLVRLLIMSKQMFKYPPAMEG